MADEELVVVRAHERHLLGDLDACVVRRRENLHGALVAGGVDGCRLRQVGKERCEPLAVFAGGVGFGGRREDAAGLPVFGKPRAETLAAFAAPVLVPR